MTIVFPQNVPKRPALFAAISYAVYLYPAETTGYIAGCTSTTTATGSLKTTPSASDSATPSGRLGEERLQHIVGYQLAQAALVTYGVFEELVGAPLKLRPVEYTILTLVKENAGVSPAQLSDALAVTRPNITVWIDKLEARGLVRREKNVNDRRGQLLRATERGAALAEKATRLLIEGEREAFSSLTPVEHMMLTELLHKLARSRRADAVTNA